MMEIAEKRTEAIIKQKGIKIRDASHKKCVELFVLFLSAYTSNPNTLKGMIELMLERNIGSVTRETGCFNGKYQEDALVEPLEVDLYIRYDSLQMNVYYISNVTDLERAFKYSEQKENEYKVLVYDERMKEIVASLGTDKCLVFPEEMFRKFH